MLLLVRVVIVDVLRAGDGGCQLRPVVRLGGFSCTYKDRWISWVTGSSSSRLLFLGKGWVRDGIVFTRSRGAGAGPERLGSWTIANGNFLGANSRFGAGKVGFLVSNYHVVLF